MICTYVDSFADFAWYTTCSDTNRLWLCLSLKRFYSILMLYLETLVNIIISQNDERERRSNVCEFIKFSKESFA